jgi:hypothetical protein
MSESDGRSPSVAKSDEERAAFFEELMAEERRRQPVSGPAVATLVLGLLGGLLAPIVGFFALQRIRKDGEKGRPLVYVGLAAFAVWVVVFAYLISTGQLLGQRSEPELVSGFDLKVGQCFAAPGMSGESDVIPLSCTDAHTGEVFGDFAVPDGPYPGTVELYDASLRRCKTLADGNAAAVTISKGLVQVMTPTRSTWEKGPSHRIVCYVAFPYKFYQSI